MYGEIMNKFITCFLITIISMFIAIDCVEAKNLSFNDGILVMSDYKTQYDRVDDFSGNCADFANVIRMGGYLLFIVKILIPLIIIVKGSMNFVAVVSDGKPETLKKNFQKILTSIIAGVIIFFIPTIISVIFGFVSRYNANISDDSKVCAACVFEPFSNTCSYYAER